MSIGGASDITKKNSKILIQNVKNNLLFLYFFFFKQDRVALLHVYNKTRDGASDITKKNLKAVIQNLKINQLFLCLFSFPLISIDVLRSVTVASPPRRRVPRAVAAVRLRCT